MSFTQLYYIIPRKSEINLFHFVSYYMLYLHHYNITYHIVII